MNSNNITYSCLCNNLIKKETAFCFLEDLKTLFLDNVSIDKLDNMAAFSLNESFRPQIKSKMVYIV